MHAHVGMTPHTRFVLRRGVFSWGLLAGTAAAALVVGGGRDDASSAYSTIILCTSCFALWTVLIGWTVGASANTMA
jgi:hypothetical protein